MMKNKYNTFYKTHNISELSLSNIGEKVVLSSWVNRVRKLGSISFIELKDRFGTVQVLLNESLTNKYDIKVQYVIKVIGVVSLKESINDKKEIEIRATEIEILSASDPLPFNINNKEVTASEDLRLEYRYLDFRRSEVMNPILLRSKLYYVIHEFFHALNFVEVETPILTKSTPEGARDYLVPSRLYKGEFYALPQSPQLFKQILMISSFDRYYQIARAFRDEDLRSDRQPDFTQLDMEMSFATSDDIFLLTESLMQKIFKSILNIDLQIPFSRMKYQDAIRLYGSDKPDLRFDNKIVDLKECFKDSTFHQFSDSNISINGLIFNDDLKLTRKVIDSLNDIAKKNGVSPLYTIKKIDNQLSGSIVKNLTDSEQTKLLKLLNNNEILFFVASSNKRVSLLALGVIRLEIAKLLSLIKDNSFAFSWVVDFPLFSLSESGEIVSEHHPFTAPKLSQINELESKPLEIVSDSYDLVLNGFELLSGSVRIHNQELQSRIFNILGLNDEDIKNKFGFFTKALRFGTPPHAGFGLGLDRLAMILSNTSSIRDVIAFPKNNKGVCPLTHAPSKIEEKELKILHLKIEE